MRRISMALLGFLLWHGPALAECAGRDLLAEMAAADPAGHAALLGAAHETPNGQGKFWRVARGDAPPSYLYGTFHDTGIARDPLDPAVATALDGARLMMVELTAAEEARMQARMTSDPDFVMEPGRSGLFERLSPEERADTAAWLGTRGIPPEMAERLRSWVLFSMLSVPDCMFRDALAGAPILDSLLRDRAAAAGVPVAGLERYEDALGAIDAISPELRIEMLLGMLEERPAEEDIRATVARLYRDGEIAAIWEFSSRDAAATMGEAGSAEMFAAIEAELMEGRNRAWVAAMAPELAKGGVFAAFGALHLPGAAGMVELLRAAGFEVTRLDG
jgi:uncharacterized protein YbaP (TraB family)